MDRYIIAWSMWNLQKFNYNHNFFNVESPMCMDLEEFDDGKNCFHGRPVQRSRLQCKMFLSKPLDCSVFKCREVFAPKLNPPPPLPSPTPKPALPPPPSPTPKPALSPPPSPPVPPCQQLQSPPPPSPTDYVPLPPIYGKNYTSPPPPPLY
ncbi:hypothetical protein HRI_000075200 [Hibiscus trionum]|uniref:Uncharacterized protein n=1 Tax=Hibiscus trionum TaxID=183268 RepID=A0A9W7GQX1_HIBTR|nr:hypothetical protein HRI_000075200 [Hibiscus trionum]